MGLDGVELVLRIEEEFGIEITDAEAGTATTVGKVYDLVMSKIGDGNENRCLTMSAFYRTRKAIVAALGIAKQSVRPSTEMNALIAEEDRAQIWGSIRRASELG